MLIQSRIISVNCSEIDSIYTFQFSFEFLLSNQKLQYTLVVGQILELLIQRDKEFQELMKLALDQGKIHHEMQLLEKVVEKRDNDIQQLQKQLKEAEHILVSL